MDRLDKAQSKDKLSERAVCVVGLGTIGLPLALGFARNLKVIGFDVNSQRAHELQLENHNTNLLLTDNPEEIRKADFILIAVPTPLTESKTPDLSYLENACKTVSQNLKRGSIVVIESTVYPGATEEVVKPILEESGFKCGTDFKLACSPERVNPGDEEHSLGKVAKVVGGMDVATTELVAELYSLVVSDVVRVRDIRTAEATKLVENVQRDVNIALVNELALVFETLGLDTREVLQAAATKWNFHSYSPGLVGGYCIPVSPYYFLYKAKEASCLPRLISTAREVNDYMPQHVVNITTEALRIKQKAAKGTKVLVLGLAYKENVEELRYSPVAQILKQLRELGMDIVCYEPVANRDVKPELGFQKASRIEDLKDIDCVILATAHDAFREVTLDRLSTIVTDDPILIDIRGFYKESEAKAKGFYYRSL